MTAQRLDVALPLAQFYIERSRSSGDLRFLGYADADLAPWLAKNPVDPSVLVLHATVLQSRHEFTAALAELDRALAAQPDNAQAWLTRATVLRVLGRFEEALSACDKLAPLTSPAITTLCRQSLLGLTGHLNSAYDAIAAIDVGSIAPEAQAWRASELGEMAVRRGRDAEAEQWFRQGLVLAPNDFYIRAAYADLLLRQQRPAEVLQILKDRDSMEPLLLRIAIAQKAIASKGTSAEAMGSAERLAAAFAAEAQRGDAVHRREQARFLLDVENKPAEALAAAQANWQVQHEPDDILIFVRAAAASSHPEHAAPVLQFVEKYSQQDARLEALQQAETSQRVGK